MDLKGLIGRKAKKTKKKVEDKSSSDKKEKVEKPKTKKQKKKNEDLRDITEKVLDKSAEGIISKEKDLEKAYAKKKGEWEIKNLLKQAKRLEIKEEYLQAIDLYKAYLGKRLALMESQKKYGLKDYYKLADYYVKIAELYTKIHHIKTESST